MIAESELSELVPEAYAAYRPLVRDALGTFLGRLPRARVTEIAGAQSRLPADTPAAARLRVLFGQCPTLHKLGQVLARDRRLPRSLRAQFVRLETLPATTEVRRLRPAIDRALGGCSGISIAPRALAEASVSVIVPFRVDGRPDASGRGVFKVLKPGIRERLEQDLAAWAGLGELLEQRAAHYGLPDLDYREIIDGIGSRVADEVMLARERSHIDEASGLYAPAPDIQVPALFPFCTGEVTAMSRMDGVKITAVPAGLRRQAARRAADALIARPLFHDQDGATFHADPHAGNLIVGENAGLGIVDWSLVARIGRRERKALMDVLIAGLGFDELGLCRGIARLSSVNPREKNLRALAADAVAQLRGGARPGVRWMTSVLDRAVTGAGLTVSGDVILLRKALHTLTGVIDDLSAGETMDAAIIAGGLRRYAQACLLRTATPADPRWSSVMTANATLLRLWRETPAAAARFWLGTWRDLLAAQRI
ncbi:MAG: AarF/UbiB family protein [Gammaproteobacteria bacterium]|nr:AarF/UbiB family protein [Gammaproteobacteria bacterium]